MHSTPEIEHVQTACETFIKETEELLGRISKTHEKHLRQLVKLVKMKAKYRGGPLISVERNIEEQDDGVVDKGTEPPIKVEEVEDNARLGTDAQVDDVDINYGKNY